MNKVSIGIALFGLTVSLLSRADIPPQPSLNRVNLNTENLSLIYKLMPGKEVHVPNAIKEQGASVFRKIHRDVKIDDRYNSSRIKRALICDRTEYQRNKSIPAVNKYSCSEVQAVRTELPKEDPSLLRIAVTEDLANN